jgi:hypothetical protein
LKDLIENIANTDDDAIIFQEDLNDLDSSILLYLPDEDDTGLVKEENGIIYHYLIEVFLAKEFLNDWLSSLSYIPPSEEMAKRLQEYAINDA